MNDNLPDINFKEKKEKKAGFIGWMRGKLGFGSRGSMGQAGINPAGMNAGRSAMDFGKAFGAGAGKFGASGGIAGLLAGKGGLIATMAMVAVAGGLYLANNAPAPSTGTAAFSSGRTADNYVPAILRSQAANQGSSLEMFKDTNKGSLSMEEQAAAAKNNASAENPAGAEEGQAGETGEGEQSNMGQDMMAKMQGGEMSSLTSQLGGGSNKFSNMGGFNNKFNQGQTGLKTGFTSGIGSGFSSMPKFDARKNKMLAMKTNARPVFGGAKAGKKGKIGAGAFGQAKGLRATQKSYSGSSIDSARSTQDQAWEGSTGEGDAGSGGSGLSDGGAGIVTSPSLDNAGSGGGGGGAGIGDEPVVPDATSPTDVSPWANLLTTVMMLVMIACILAFIAAQIQLWWVRWIVAAIALILAIVAIVMAAQIMAQYGQKLLGGVYLIAGICAAAAAAMAFGGKAKIPPGAETVTILAAASGLIMMMGSMFAGK